MAAGAKLWLVQPLGFQLSEKRLRRAGLDYWQYLDLEIVHSWEHLRTSIPCFRPWKFTKHANKSYTDVSYQQDESFVFGSESHGLPESIMSSDKERNVRLPMEPHVRSLNLSTTAGIAIYEYQRQMAIYENARAPTIPPDGSA